MDLFATSLDNQNLLRALEVAVVVLVWLFFLRIVRAVWVEVRPPKRRGAAAVEAHGAPVPAEGRRERGRRFKLRVVEPEPLRGQLFELPDDVTVGRAAGCGVRVEDGYTSNLHARLYRRDGTLWVEDLGSTNGTWVNAQRVEGATRVGKGDLLQIGGTVFEVTR